MQDYSLGVCNDLCRPVSFATLMWIYIPFSGGSELMLVTATTVLGLFVNFHINLDKFIVFNFHLQQFTMQLYMVTTL